MAIKTAEIYVLPTIDTTIPSPGDPTYQTECASLEWRQTMRNLNTAGFVFQKPDELEFSAFNTEVMDFLSAANTRFDEILQTGASSVVANLPNVLNIMAAISSGGSSEVLSILLNALVGTAFHWRDSQIEAAQGEPTSDLDLTALITELGVLFSNQSNTVASLLQDIRQATGWLSEGGGTFTDVLTEFKDLHISDGVSVFVKPDGEENHTIPEILDKALIDLNAQAERFSILWSLARQAIRVQVASVADLDDVLLDEST